MKKVFITSGADNGLLCLPFNNLSYLQNMFTREDKCTVSFENI